MPSRIAVDALAALGVILLAAPAAAQQSSQPYAGFQTRQIKTLSAEQVADLAAGRGMGLALAAELNGYPGPLHVMELADQLGLTQAQRTAVERHVDLMRSDAVQLGQRLIAAERELDRAFAERTVTPKSLHAATALIGVIGGELRNTHLRHHLSTAEVLTADQLRRYAELRGFSGSGAIHRGARPHGAADDQHRHSPRAPRH